MPGFDKDELSKMENPYKELCGDADSRADTLAENREELNALSSEEKTALATQLVIFCPKTDLQSLKRDIEALRHPENNDASFHAVISNALQLRMMMDYLQHPDSMPYTKLVDEFDPAIFHELHALRDALLPKDTRPLAIHLICSTSKDKQSALVRNTGLAFDEHSDFVKTVREALTLQQQLDQLTGAEPHKVFISRDCNADLYNKFSQWVGKALQGQAQAIGEKLAKAPYEHHFSISRFLEQISANTSDRHHPLKQITQAFSEHREKKQLLANSDSAIINPNALFSATAGLRQRHGSTVETMQSIKHAMGDKEDENTSICPSCTLL